MVLLENDVEEFVFRKATGCKDLFGKTPSLPYEALFLLVFERSENYENFIK